MPGLSQNPREVLNLVEDVVYGLSDLHSVSLSHSLLRHLQTFISLLFFKVPSQEARQKVQSGVLELSNGSVRLDQRDISEVLLLSDEMQLDELLCASYLESAQAQRGDVSAEAAAGLHMEDRRCQLASLHLLLQAQALPPKGLPADVQEALATVNSKLLSHSVNQRLRLLERLIELTQATLKPSKTSGRLQYILDATGQQVPMQQLVQAERSVLSECLMYAACIKPRVQANDLAALVMLLESMATFAAGTGSRQAAGDASKVCLALLLMLLPTGEDAEGNGNGYSRHLGTMTDNEALSARLAGFPATAPGLLQLLSFAWGTVLSAHGPDDSHTDAANLIAAGLDVGVFRCVIGDWLKSTAFEDDSPALQQLQAQMLHQLLMLFLDCQPVRTRFIEHLADSDTQQAEDAAASQGGGQQLQVAMQRPPDGLSSLLALLGAIFAVHPALGIDNELRAEVFEELMDYVGRSQIMETCPSVLVAYLGVLTSLAATQQGAQAVHGQLSNSGTMYATLSWTRAFDIMKTYCQRYSQDSQQDAAERSRKPGELMVPESDASALAAYLQLLARVVSNGPPARVPSWVAAWEAQSLVSPLWELLFQLMCHPVPQELKAALDGALAAFAGQGDALAMWGRLLQAVVVQPFAAAPDSLGSSLVPSCDITYQLHEIEMRAQSYGETLAFVQLLNALLAAAGSRLPDHGVPYRHYTHFVRVHVFGHITQRAYSKQGQQWELAAAALDHLRMCLQLLLPPSPPESPPQQPLYSHPPLPSPGLAVMQDLLGDGEAARPLWGLLLSGPDDLARERAAGPHGKLREAAVLAALKLLRAAFERDEAAALALSAGSGVGVTLDTVLQRDRRRLPGVLQWVRYSARASIQMEAIKLAHILSSRMGTFVDLLLQAPADKLGSPYHHIIHGFADCLHSAIFAPAADSVLADDSDDDSAPATGGTEADPRAALILQLLGSCVEFDAPNFAHLLLGMDVTGGFDGVASSQLEADRSFSCLSPVLDAMQCTPLADRQPQVYEACLSLIHALACGEASAPPMLRFLALQPSSFAPLLDAPLQLLASQQASEAAAGAQQAAQLLGLLSQQLHTADLAIPAYARACSDILTQLFCSPPSEAGLGREGSRMLCLLSSALFPVQQPHLDAESQGDVRRMQQRMGVDELLASDRSVEEGGVRTSVRGLPCFHIPFLAQALQLRGAEQEQEARRYAAGGSSAAAATATIKAACKAALSTAQKWNAWAQATVAQTSLIAAWKSAVEVTFACRYELLGKVLTAAKSGVVPAAVLQSLLSACLELLKRPEASSLTHVTPLIAQTVRCLMARLHEQTVASFALAPDPLAGLKGGYHAWLRALVAVLVTHQQDTVRLPLLGALLSYLLLSSDGSHAQLPSPVLDALLEGAHMARSVRGAGAASAQQGAAAVGASQARLQAGNARIVAASPPLLQLITALAARAAGNELPGTLALMLLAALLSADSAEATSALSQPSLAEGMCGSGLPVALLQDVASCHAALGQQAPVKAARAAAVAEAQLHLLLALMQATVASQAAAFGLPPEQTLAAIARCQVLELHAAARDWHNDSVQAKGAGSVASAVLRLAVAAASVQPANKSAQREAHAFVAQHASPLLSILRAAGSNAPRDWQEDLQVLHQARLTVALLATLQHSAEPSVSVPPQLQEAVLHLMAGTCCLDRTASCAAIARSHELRSSDSDMGGFRRDDRQGWVPDRQALQQMALHIQNLRAALLGYVRRLVMQPRSGWLMRIASSPTHPGPCLLLLRETLHQADRDLSDAISLQLRLQDRLSSLQAASPAPSAQNGGSAGGLQLANGKHTERQSPQEQHFSRLSIARSAAACEEEIGVVLYLIENALAVMLHHMLHKHASDLGPERDLQQLVRLMQPLLAQLQRYDSAVLEPGHDAGTLQVLMRRMQAHLSG